MSAFDTVVAGGTLIDGTAEATPRRCDIAITDGMIADVGDLSVHERRHTIDATGRVVTPGFIDTHTHIEMAALSGHDDGLAAVRQGVTTTLVGADRFGWVGLASDDRIRWWEDMASIYGRPPSPLPTWPHPADFLGDLRAGSAHEVLPLVPHGNVRAAVMGASPVAPTAAEMRRMCSLVDDWMEAGAVGLASGLDYLPGRSSTTDEIVELARIVASGGGVYASHVRTIDLGRADGWRDAAAIGALAGIPVRIAHERLDDIGMGLLDELSDVVDITVDSYVYPAGCTSLAFHVPAEDLAEGAMAMSRRLATDTEFAERLATHLQERMTGNPGQQALIAATTSGAHEGRTLDQLAEDRNATVGEVAVQLLRDEMPCALLVYIWQHADAGWERTVTRTLRDPRTFIVTDGVYLGSHAHPRGFGTFPRILGEYVREKQVVSLSWAVHKMTGMPAHAYGLDDRGTITTGRRADLVVLDPETVGCPADPADPRHPPTGIERVLIGGVTVVNNEEQR